MQECNDIVVLPKELLDRVKFIVVYSHQEKAAYSLDVTQVRNTRGAEQLFYRLAMQQFRRHKKPLYGFLCPSMINGTICPFERNCRDIHVTPNGYSERKLWTRPLQSPRVLAEQSRLQGSASENQKILVYTTSDNEEQQQAVSLTSVCSLALVLSAVNSGMDTRTTSVAQVPYHAVNRVQPGLSPMVPQLLPPFNGNQLGSPYNDPFYGQINRMDPMVTLPFQNPFPNPASVVPYPTLAPIYPSASVNGSIISHVILSPTRGVAAQSSISPISWGIRNNHSHIQPPLAPPPAVTCPHCGNQWSVPPADPSMMWASPFPLIEQGPQAIADPTYSEPKAYISLPYSTLSTLNNSLISSCKGSVKVPCELTVEIVADSDSSGGSGEPCNSNSSNNGNTNHGMYSGTVGRHTQYPSY
jgi:hypothetical protein